MQLEKLIKQLLVFIRQNGIIFLLLLFLAVDVAFVPSIFLKNSNVNQPQQIKTTIIKDSLRNSPTANILKISAISGSRIDGGAASIERQRIVCPSLPGHIWMFLFLTYIILLVFNLSFDFHRVTKVQWFWELLLTLLAIVAWQIFDPCKINAWYPLYVLKIGILIYAAYLYFFGKKMDNAE